MGEAFDTSFHSDFDIIDLGTVTQLKPNAVHRTTESVHSARVGRYVKPPSDARPLDGWPAYNPAGPAPSLAMVPSVDSVFPDTFGIWATTRCLRHIASPARLHEVLFLIGFSTPHTERQCRRHFPTVLTSLRSSPGMQAFMNMLQAIQHAKQQTRVVEVPLAAATTSTHRRPMEAGNTERPRYALDRRSSFQKRFGTQSRSY
jgi:hypothetical protein